MAEAIARGLIAAQVLAPSAIVVSDVRPDRLSALQQELGVSPAASNVDATRGADVVIVSVKPQDVRGLLAEIQSTLTPQHLVISIAAGITLAFLQEALPLAAVVRVMPNTPALVQAGMAVLSPGTAVTADQQAVALRIFAAVGRAIVLPESYLDAVTALSGSGPGFLAVVADALADAGVRCGLPRDVALLLTAQTMLGTGQLLVERTMHPAALKDAVTSPGGTTSAGLHALERGAIRATLIDAVVAAAERSAELGRAAHS